MFDATWEDLTLNIKTTHDFCEGCAKVVEDAVQIVFTIDHLDQTVTDPAGLPVEAVWMSKDDEHGASVVLLLPYNAEDDPVAV